MGGLTLLDRARSAGLSVTVEADRLVIKGPRRAGPIVRELMAHKPEVMALLAAAQGEPTGSSSPPPPPTNDDDVDAGLLWHSWRSARIAEAGVPKPEAERLAYRELMTRLAGNERSPLFTWEELAGWRWGPA